MQDLAYFSLGNGRQGVARRCVHKLDPTRQGVLKTLLNNTSHQARARMFREVAALQSLFEEFKARVPQVYAHNTHRHTENCELYLVMEFIPGSVQISPSPTSAKFTPVAWYEDDPRVAEPAIRDEIDGWIRATMTDMAERILAKGTSK